MPKCITLTGRNEHEGIASLWVILMKSCRKGMIETLMKRYRRKTRLAKNYGVGESVNLLLGLVGGPVSLGKSRCVTNSAHSCFLLNCACHLQVRTCAWIIFNVFFFLYKHPQWILNAVVAEPAEEIPQKYCTFVCLGSGHEAYLPLTCFLLLYFLQHLSLTCSHVLI